MRRLVAAPAGVALAFAALAAPVSAATTIGAQPASGTGPLVCPAGYVNYESRGWWTPTGQSFDQYRGVDVEVCWPQNGHMTDTTFLLHVQLRRLHAPITTLRVCVESNCGGARSRSVHLAPDAAGYGEWYIPFTIIPSTRSGWDEYRFTANVPHDEDNLRQYQSTGLQAWTTSSSGSYRKLPYWETRGWYKATGYGHGRTNVNPPTLAQPVSGTWTLPWSCPDTSGSEIAVAYLDANTHAIPMVLPALLSVERWSVPHRHDGRAERCPSGRHAL